jgi:protein-S-isoprenylcysteine O-methyltransferase Ste14
MKTSTVEKLAWVLLYSGLLLVCLGIFVLRGGAGWGWALILVGAADALAGIGLIVLRSRMRSNPRVNPREPAAAARIGNRS